MSQAIQFKILPIREEHIEAFRQAVGSVARERRYLAFLDAPSFESTREFVLRNIEEGMPHFVAMVDAQIVGWCDISSLDRPVFAHVGSLGIGVINDYRGQGIGKALMQAALAKAKEKGLTRIELTVRESNYSAISLYESLGFQVEGVHQNAVLIDGQYENHVCMALLF